jgi:hypothetical protein
MERCDGGPSTAPWSLHGEQERLVEAARILRYGIELGLYRSNPLGEYGMFGVARLLDALAHSLHTRNDVHHTVVSAAMEVADHVVTYLLPMVQAVRGRENGQDSRNDSERSV